LDSETDCRYFDIKYAKEYNLVNVQGGFKLHEFYNCEPLGFPLHWLWTSNWKEEYNKELNKEELSVIKFKK